MTLHDKDFYSWTQQQAALLRANNIAALDIENLLEEIEDMGLSQVQGLENRLTVLLAHLLKWKYQPEHRSSSWEGTIREQRNKVKRLLRKNPGLQSILNETLFDSYEDARPSAMRETELPLNVFPLECPWAFKQIMDDDFWPEAK